jgi:hypothetical protein
MCGWWHEPQWSNLILPDFEQNSSRPYQLKERFFPREVGHEFYQHKANDRFGNQKKRFLYSVRRGTQACWNDVGLK